MLSHLAYNTHGKGNKHVVFIHGYCERKEMWLETVEELASQLENITFWAIDLPGFGESPLDEKITSLDEVALAVNDFFEIQNIHKAHLVGHSLGGYVICAFLKRFNKKVIDASLIHSVIFEDNETKKTGRNKTISFLEKHGLTLFIRNFIPELYAPENKIHCQKDIETGIELGLTTPLQTAINYMRFMRDRTDSSYFLSHCQTPVHFIIGTKDRSVAIEQSLEQLTYPLKSTGIILENTGHMGMFERKNAVLTFLSAILDK